MPVLETQKSFNRPKNESKPPAADDAQWSRSVTLYNLQCKDVHPVSFAKLLKFVNLYSYLLKWTVVGLYTKQLVILHVKLCMIIYCLKCFWELGNSFFAQNSIWRLFAYIVNPTSDWCQNVCCMSFFTGWISTVAQSSDVLVQVHCSLLFSFPLYFLNTDNKYFFIFRCFPFLLMNALKDRWQGWSPSNGISVFQFNIFLCIAK